MPNWFSWGSAPKTWTAVMVDVPDLNNEIRDRMNALAAAINSLQDKIYPIGSIYENSSVATNPADPTMLGFGTWALWGVGRVAVCVDTGQTEFDTLEEEGGEKTHVLTIGEMPVHNHDLYTPNASGGFNQVATTGGNNTEGANLADTSTTIQNKGGGGAHNNLQPYKTLYRWKRVS